MKSNFILSDAQITNKTTICFFIFLDPSMSICLSSHIYFFKNLEDSDLKGEDKLTWISKVVQMPHRPQPWHKFSNFNH